MKSENLIHIKFEYDSALKSKKDILASEIDLLKIFQRVKNYKKLRLKEIDEKTKLNRKLRALKLNIGRLQNLLPKIKIPEILKPEGERRIEIKEKEPEEDNIEKELQKIQKRLNTLQK